MNSRPQTVHFQRKRIKDLGQDAEDGTEQSLYEVRRKIYPRGVSGWFAGWRVALVLVTQLVFYGTAWLQWNDRQAVLFDLGARKFYIFGLVLWPQDFVYLTALLVISALALFLFTAVAGRLWCGYACPQTVYTELFMWIERRIEGDRQARMRLDREASGVRKYALKAAKHAAWIALALWTGFTFVGYFTPIRELAHLVPSLSLGPWESFWMLFYSFATYGNAGWMREQVCMYMCPYARFQSAMFDLDTLNITYDKVRGEPRGARSRSADAASLRLGDCVDCSICVQVCPTGIDIREGLQYECIGCAACVDACNQVMKKMNYPPGLIRYTTENAINGRWGMRQIIARVFRSRVLVYSAVLGAVVLAVATTLWQRVPLKLDIIRDRASLARDVGEGRIENIYRLQIMNTAERPVQIELSVAAPEALEHVELLLDSNSMELPAVSTTLVPIRVRAQAKQGSGRSHSIEFTVGVKQGAGHSGRPIRAKEKSIFMVPSMGH